LTADVLTNCRVCSGIIALLLHESIPYFARVNVAAFYCYIGVFLFHLVRVNNYALTTVSLLQTTCTI